MSTRTLLPGRRGRAALLIVLALLWAQAAHAEGFWFGSGGAGWTFDGGFGEEPVTTPFFPGNSQDESPVLDWDHTFNGEGEASAQLGVGRGFTEQSVFVTFAPGTGVSQDAPAGGNTAAMLTIDFSADAEARGGPGISMQDCFGSARR